MSFAGGDVRTVLSDVIDTWQRQWPCFSTCTCDKCSEQSRPRSPLLGNSSVTISGSLPCNGLHIHVHFSTRLLVMHLRTASVPTGIAVSVGTSAKLILAEIQFDQSDKRVARGYHREEHVRTSWITRRTFLCRNFERFLINERLACVERRGLKS